MEGTPKRKDEYGMKAVDPIRSRKQIETMKTYLKGKSMRDYLLTSIGFSAGLRISDILSLRVKDLYTPDGDPLEFIELNEKKTRKRKKFPVTDSLRSALHDYAGVNDLTEMGLDAYIFTGRNNTNRPISRQRALTIIKQAAEDCGIKDNVGTHSLRKSFGTHLYNSGVSIDLISMVLGHRSQEDTRRYLGFVDEDLNRVYNKLNL